MSGVLSCKTFNLDAWLLFDVTIVYSNTHPPRHNSLLLSFFKNNSLTTNECPSQALNLLNCEKSCSPTTKLEMENFYDIKYHICLVSVTCI